MYKRTTKWENLSTVWRAVVIAAAMLMLFSNGLFVCMAEMCFRPFAVSSKIDDRFVDDGLEGNVFNIVIHPVGSGGLGLFAIAVLLHCVFVKIMTLRANRELAASRSGGDCE